MKLKILQWNIGGGKIRKQQTDGRLANSYNVEGLDYIVNIIRRFNPDIVTLQETHANEITTQASILAENLGISHYCNDNYDMSHLESGQKLGQAVLSRFPINDHTFELFYNPKYELVRANGEKWVSHNKGVTRCVLQIGTKELVVETLHFIPFRKFGIDLLGESARLVISDISKKVKNDAPYFLLQGDFNLDDQSLRGFLPEIFSRDLHEILLTAPTTPTGRKYDHTLYRGLRLSNHEIFTDALTDHFPVFTEFEFRQG